MAPIALLDSHESPGVGLVWLSRLRWIVVGGGTAAVLVARALEAALPAAPMLAVLGAILASNVALGRRATSANASILGATLIFDTLALTALLALSGGPSNPFSILFMVQITVAAVLLSRRWTWLVVGLSVACFGALFVVHKPLPAMSHGHHHGGFDLHLYGMFGAFALAAAAIAHVVTRIAEALRSREAELDLARRLAERNQRMAALTTLAGGAAHELGSPLATIAVAARELERAVRDDAPLADDVRLIRDEVGRCRRILDRMHNRATEEGGEAIESVTVATLVDALTESLSAPRAARLRCQIDAPSQALRVPKEAFVQALVNLVDNAFDASSPDATVDLAASLEGTSVRFSVTDRGSGMPEDVAARAIEPFFTTKAAGHGMGLGLFLAQNVVDRVGGALRLESQPGVGTSARLEVPT